MYKAPCKRVRESKSESERGRERERGKRDNGCTCRPLYCEWLWLSYDSTSVLTEQHSPETKMAIGIIIIIIITIITCIGETRTHLIFIIIIPVIIMHEPCMRTL